MPENDPEFERIVGAVETLEKVALEHESHQTGPHRGPCFENRTFIIAMAMRKLDLTVGDIGAVAEQLFDIECQDEADEANASVPSEPSDDVLDAKSLSGL